MIKPEWKAVDNTNVGLKVAVREWGLKQITEPHVLDLFCGYQAIRKLCYQGMPYLGIDVKPDTPADIHCDNREYLKTADLAPWNLMDIDAYGNPWEQFLLISKRKHGRFVCILTECIEFNVNMNSITIGMKGILGIPRKMRISCLGRHLEFMRSVMVKYAEEQFGVKCLDGIRAKAGNANYFAGVFERRK